MEDGLIQNQKIQTELSQKTFQILATVHLRLLDLRPPAQHQVIQIAQEASQKIYQVADQAVPVVKVALRASQKIYQVKSLTNFVQDKFVNLSIAKINFS